MTTSLPPRGIGRGAPWASGIRRLAALCLTLLCAFFWAESAQAQTSTFSNTTTGAIDNATTCTAPLVRNFTVGSSFTVSDVNIGVLATHTWRGDLQITLQAPNGTRIQLVNGDSNNISGDNFNVLLDNSGTQTVNTDGNTTNHTTSAPPYQNTFVPNASLAGFNGINSNGTWRLEICDLFPSADNGTFQRADLYLTQTPTNYADLSLTKTVSNASPAFGASISYTLAVTNAAGSPQTANSVTVQDTLPAGVTFVSASGFGTYNSTTGVWTVGSIPAGTTRTLTINVSVNATSGATVSNIAEVSASSVADLDSTPGNGATGEDDRASVSFTVSGTRVAGTPPTLACPVGSSLLDWDTLTWTAGSTSNAYALTALGTVNFSIALNGGSWLTNATYGGQSPARQNVVTAGLSPAQFSIMQLVNFTSSTSSSAVTTITLPTAVPGVQFTLVDIDFASGQFSDRVTVTGTFNGTTVLPTLTNGIANYVIGNSAYGDATSSDTQANGNVVVTFATPVDTITIDYGNHSTAPADPGQQAITIHDINFCRPQANISVAKTSTIVSDPTNGTTNPKFTPGAIVRYCILASNSGSGTATNIAITDSLPATVTYIPGSMTSATSCAATGTAEDDDATGGDETDPFGMQISGMTIGGTATSIGPSSAFAMRFNVTVN